MITEQADSLTKVAPWAGRVLSALPVFALLVSGSMKLTHRPEYVQMLVVKFGYHEGSVSAIGVVEILGVILYAFPRTAVLGAVLLTGFLGGAMATHVRVSENFAPPMVLGLLLWAGLLLREGRLRALLPVRKQP